MAREARPASLFLPGLDFESLPRRDRLKPIERDALIYVGHRPFVTEATLVMAVHRSGLGHDRAVEIVDGLAAEGFVSVSPRRRGVTLTEKGLQALGPDAPGRPS